MGAKLKPEATPLAPEILELLQELIRARQSAVDSALAITAVMRKLVALANTLLTENRLWLPVAPQTA